MTTIIPISRASVVLFVAFFCNQIPYLNAYNNSLQLRRLPYHRPSALVLRIRGQRTSQPSRPHFISAQNRHQRNTNKDEISPNHYSSRTSTLLLCQLLGMNCATPTDFTFSFKGFSLRGGGTDIHGHGWGIAFYEGRGLRAFHDPEPCSSSPIAELVSNYPLRTYNMMAHIRYATRGEVCLENVHPFHREMVRRTLVYPMLLDIL